MGGGGNYNESQWYTVRIIKPIKLFTVHVNEEFSLFEKTGLVIGSNIRSPYFLYNFRHLIATSYHFDANLKFVKLNEDKYKLIPNKDISSNSIVDVIVIESDNIEETKTKSSIVQNFSWKTKYVLSSEITYFESYTLNKKNNWTLDLSNSKLKDSKLKFMFWFKNVKYLDGMYELKIEFNNIDLYKYKYSLKQKGAMTQITKEFTTTSRNQYANFIVKDVYSLLGTTNRTAIFNNPSSSNVLVYVNDNKVAEGEVLWFYRTEILQNTCQDAFGYSGIDGMNKNVPIKIWAYNDVPFENLGTVLFFTKSDTWYDVTSKSEVVCLVIKEVD